MHTVGTPDSEHVSAGFPLQGQIPWAKVGERGEESTFIIHCRAVMSVTQCLHPESRLDCCCNLILDKS